MKADAAPLLSIFEKKLRLEVPLFQRQYVWNRELQWEPLWEDISRKFTNYLEGRKDTPVHFLGAMVLDLKMTPTTHVEKRQVIDGQQRLITLQIFLSTFRDFCQEHGFKELAAECDSFILNKGMMAEPEVDKFKVWPTSWDRDQFTDVISAGSRIEIERKHPLVRRKYAKKYDPRPRMIEAYIFFYNQLTEFFIGTDSDPPLASDQPLSKRLEESFQALKNALYVAIIDLDKDDDAQVIFETLNARGEPLLPADLLRNYIFLRAARQGENQEKLYNEYWKSFDDQFWREVVRQGRLMRPRSDLFMQHFLASQRTADIPIRHLYVEYKYWIEKEKPFASIKEELSKISQQCKDFRRIISPTKNDILFPLATFLKQFDVSTVYPLLLYLLDSNLTDEQLKTISQTLESYIVRRAICGYTIKGYNRIFLSMIQSLRSEGASPENIQKFLMRLRGESAEWPSNDTFQSAWQTNYAYLTLNNSKLVYILRRLSDTYFVSGSEEISIETPLTVEHLLPRDWIENWPLPDGSKGMNYAELLDAKIDDPRAIATKYRNSILQTIGNLTILTQPLNSSFRNKAWNVKKPALLSVSLLSINQQLHQYNSWDESNIETRSKELFNRALNIWPKPKV